jgi:hypothetical protein
MTINHFRRDSCRLCASTALSLALKLKPTPLANALVPKSRLGDIQPVFPLDIFLCDRCKHLQLLDVVDPRVLYEHYVYVSGTSPVFVEHFRRYAESMFARFASEPGVLAVDIGSNDGTLLSFFKQSGCRVLGVDPAIEIARDAATRGIPTLVEFFSPGLATQIVEKHGTASIVTANNVFAHLDDVADFLTGIRTLIGRTGVFAFEASYLRDVIEKGLFDMFYHEHLDYHSVAPLVPFFESHGLELIDAQRIDTHGGSLRGIVQAVGGMHRVSPAVAEMVKEEKRIGLDRSETYTEFASGIEDIGRELRSVLEKIKSEGKSIAGYGAPAKATTLMYHFGIGPEVVDYIVDDSPWKQSLYTPGLHIPVVPSSFMAEKKPDYVLILAWNFASSIIQKNSAFRAGGGRFIVPLPSVQVV